MLLSLNAEICMSVTVYPFIFSGIVTTSEVPEYPVIVAVPFEIEYSIPEANASAFTEILLIKYLILFKSLTVKTARNKIEEIVKVPIKFIGTGAGRDSMIVD